MNDLNMLLSCFREKMPERRNLKRERERDRLNLEDLLLGPKKSKMPLTMMANVVNGRDIRFDYSTLLETLMTL